jgi:hypothetical protein
MQQLPSAGFTDVDRSVEPNNLVSYLDQVTALNCPEFVGDSAAWNHAA